MHFIVRVAVMATMTTVALHPLAAVQSGYTADPEPALQDFNREIAAYMALRRTLAAEIAPLAANATAAEITSRSDALARAIQRSRPKPLPGVFFDAAAAVSIKQRLRTLLETPARANVFDGIEDEKPTVRNPAVYLRFPAASHLATMPPSALAALPALPMELEYRIIGADLVLRDIHAALILDVLPNAVPRR